MKKNQSTPSDLFNELIGVILLMGVAIGLVIAGVVWGIVELFQWIF